uniref:Period circadian protein homolog 2 n=1 Tax=Spermophilus dauricus TaxID=99837 RepID=A0A8C9UV74_SPEDA
MLGNVPVFASFVLEPNMNGFAEFPPSTSDPAKELMDPQPSQALLQEDVDMSSGSSGNENCSMGRDSQGSDFEDNGKELGMLVEPANTRERSVTPQAVVPSEGRGKLTRTSVSWLHSSEQSAKADAHRELVRTLRELKVHLPADKQAKGKASTLATLKYALRSVKQVKANEEYFQLLMPSDSQPCCAGVPSYTVAQVEGVTSEHILKNADMFAVAVSLVTGKILYISDQVMSIFRCKREAFGDAKFVEFLAPQDVSVFHSCTTPCKLPPWSVCGGECMEEKSFFCRVGVGENHENEIHYQPFRMTPYLAQVQERPGTESQLCCLLLAERVHSGYEALQGSPTDRHVCLPCRAVPLLGYLPQDLMDIPVLLQLHPSDRPLMLAIHKKILQSGGQPFDYSPMRFRARNGEYVTLDTSWSSFINPWSRKISFIIGRHRVRVGPLNEDVFAAPPCAEEKALPPSLQELAEQIHRLLLQPVPHSGSSGYGSLGSNGSHEHLMSQTSSSDSNGHEESRQRRAVCPSLSFSLSRYTRGHMQEVGAREMALVASGAFVAPAAPPQLCPMPRASVPEELACKDQPTCSYQQISCLDSVIRYLESCSEAATLKRNVAPAAPPQLCLPWGSADSLLGVEAARAHGGTPRREVSARLSSLALPGKAESVVSLTSQCSYSSTIVHVGDKKPQPESGASVGSLRTCQAV